MEHTEGRHYIIIAQYGIIRSKDVTKGKISKKKISRTKQGQRHNKTASIKGARDAKDNGRHINTFLSEHKTKQDNIDYNSQNCHHLG